MSLKNIRHVEQREGGKLILLARSFTDPQKQASGTDTHDTLVWGSPGHFS